MLKEMWTDFVNFLKEYDVHKLQEVVRHLNWGELASNPITWAVGIPVLGFILWKKMFKLLLLSVSFVLLIVLLQHTAPAPGQPMPLNNLLTFLGGAVAIIAVNAYFLLIREK